jgi:hypothetical protein
MTKRKKKDLDIDITVELHEPPVLKLNREELLEFRALEAEIRAAELQLQLQIILRDTYLAKVDPQNKLGEFNSSIRGATNTSAESKDSINALRARIQERLGIQDVTEYCYDDLSGVLTKPD